VRVESRRAIHPPSNRLVVVALLAALAALGACRGGADQAQVQEHKHHHALNLPPVGPSVRLSLDGKPANVDLASLPLETGSHAVPFVQLWRAAWPSEDPTPLQFDFVGSDGFRPMSRPKCTRLLTGAELATARMDVVTHDLSLDDALNLPGCYRVHAVVAVEATSPRPAPPP
jgi:hypothetical protein